MTFNSVIHRYIFRELLAPFLLSIMFFLFIFLMRTMLDITNLVVNYRVSLGTVSRMMLFSIPYFLEFILPMAAMMAVLLTFLKMSGDNEIVALKAGGYSLYKLLPPVLVFCLLGFAATTLITIYGVPWGKNGVRDLLLELKTSSYSALLKERTFNTKFKGMMVYVNKTDPKTNSLIDVFIEDRNNRGMVLTVTAPRGQMISSPDGGSFHLRLFNGFINQVRLADKSAHGIRFDTYDVRLDISKAIVAARNARKDEDEMSFTELRNHIDQATKKDARFNRVLIEIHKKFSLPFACIALGILAVPLGIQSKSVKRSFGIGLGLIFFLMYYMMLSAGWVFGEAGIYPPVIGMWAPNIVMGGLGLFMLVRSANERPLLMAGLASRLKRIWDRGGDPDDVHPS